ncbi:MAG: nitrite/sulfite reductase [Myxococcales bacterium]|nr:nitrite/sulfite reductase [Myxococcales bacterium]
MSSPVAERPRTAADLLQFADLADVDQFIDGLRKFESGEWTPDQFKVYRLNRGAYGQRQTDVNMLRIKLPAGVASAAQLEALGDAAEKYSRGFGHVTTRQNLQLHFCQLDRMPDLMRDLAEAGLTTKEACGNTVRNVTGCPMAGACAGEAFDVTPVAHAIAREFVRRPEFQSLPRKFKIALSGCSDDCAMGAINDVGLIATVVDGVRGFRMKVAGGLSTTPNGAHLLHEFLPIDRVLGAIEAVIRTFDAHGNRQNRMRARLKYVVRKHGEAGFRLLYDNALAEVRAAGRELQPIDLADGESLSRSRTLPLAPTGDHAALGEGAGEPLARFRASNVRAQKQRGFVAVTVRLVRGDATSAQFRGLADLARRFGDGMARFTIDQNLLLRFVPEARIAELHAGLAAIGLAEAGAGTIVDVTSCPGAETCNLAVTGSRELASAVTARLGEDDALALAASAAGLSVKVSGCPNSCGQHHVAAIGFHGGMRRVGGRVIPEYTLHLGGGIDATGATFGRTVIKVPARRAPAALVKLLELYEAKKAPGEDALTFFRRIPDDAVKAAVAALVKIDEATAPAEDFFDLGDTREFEVKTGVGECAV